MIYLVWGVAIISLLIFLVGWLLPYLKRKLYLYILYWKTLQSSKKVNDPKIKKLVEECADLFYKKYKEVKL